MILQKKLYEQLPYQKLGILIVSFGSYRPKTLKTSKFDQKMALNGPKYAIPEFSWHIEHDFLKEAHKNNFYTKQERQAMVPRIYNLDFFSFSFFSYLQKILTSVQHLKLKKLNY